MCLRPIGYGKHDEHDEHDDHPLIQWNGLSLAYHSNLVSRQIMIDIIILYYIYIYALDFLWCYNWQEGLVINQHLQHTVPIVYRLVGWHRIVDSVFSDTIYSGGKIKSKNKIL